MVNQFQGPTQLGVDVGFFRETGKQRPQRFVGGKGGGGDNSGGGSRTPSGPSAADIAAQEAAAEAARIAEEAAAAAAERAATLAEQRAGAKARTESQELVKSLQIREELKLEAEARGKPFTPLQAQRFFKERGSSISKLRQATKASAKKFKETGVSVAAQVREQAVTKATTPGEKAFGPQQDPYLTKVVVGHDFDSKGRKIPITKIIYVDPKQGFEREATNEEVKFFRSQPGNLVISEEKWSAFDATIGTIQSTYTGANVALKESLTGPVFDSLASVGFDPTDAELHEKTISTAFNYGFGIDLPKPITEFYGGFTSGIAKDVRDKPAKQLVLFGAGAGVGAAAQGISLGASAIGPTTSKITSVGMNIAGAGAGGYYAFKVGKDIKDIYSAPGASGKGEAFGVAAKDISLLGLGGVYGQKGAIKLYDALRVRGRTELPIEDVGLKAINEVISGKDRFVESKHFGFKGKAGKGKQKFDLSIFERSGRSYHASQNSLQLKYNKILNQKGLTVTPGSSEFAGLYVAPSPSYYFLGAKEQPIKLFGFYQGGKSPSLATLYGEGFTLKQNVYGKAFVTGVKPEIEAVFPTDTFFTKTGKETFVIYGGRKIPIDTFGVVNLGTGTGGGSNVVSGFDISSSYSSALGGSSSAVYNPISLGFSAFLNSNKEISTSSSSKSVSTKSYSPLGALGSSAVSSALNLYKSGTSLGKSSSFKKSSGGVSSGSPFKSSVSLGSKSSPFGSSLPRSSKGSPFSSSSALKSSLSSPPRRATRHPFIPSPPQYPFVKSRLFPGRVRKPQRVGLEVRRFGKFLSRGVFGSTRKATSIGTGIIRGGLGATFRLTGAKNPGLPKGFRTKIEKGSLLFIQKRRGRLSSVGEKRAIQKARKRATKKKRKKKT